VFLVILLFAIAGVLPAAVLSGLSKPLVGSRLTFKALLPACFMMLFVSALLRRLFSQLGLPEDGPAPLVSGALWVAASAIVIKSFVKRSDGSPLGWNFSLRMTVAYVLVMIAPLFFGVIIGAL